jgi:hypothetical protein
VNKLTAGIATILLLGLSATALHAQNLASVGFDNGDEGFSINNFVQIEAAGGNPGESLRYPDPIDNFGITLRNSTHPAFIGDYSVKGDVRLSLDAKVDYIQNFGLAHIRELVVILYDDDQQGPSGPAGVWTSMGILNGNGAPWTTMSIDVTDVTSATLPAGWGGRGDEDLSTFEPILPAGATYASVLAGVDRIEFTTLVPGYFFSFSHYDVSYDNVAIEPINNSAFVNQGQALAGVNGDPILQGSGDLSFGSSNSVDVSNAAPSATAGYIVGLSAISVPFKGGTLVPAPDIIIVLATDGSGEMALPFTMSAGVPSGTEIYVQVGIQDAAAVHGVALTNAVLGVTP